jgi:tRNA(Ile)-lysidine synthetase-like protein
MFAEKEFTIESAAEYCQTNSESDVYVDLSRFSDLYIRTRRDGDVIQSLGSNGRMKLKKYFMSKKIPQYERDGIILLTDGIEILWVAGVGMSEKIKVKDKPTHRLTVTN